jgi:hypothetical protein
MTKEEPKIASNIITRPAYTASGEIYKTSSVRWIGELYIKGKKIYTTTDFDCEDAAFVGVAKHIQWYQNKFKSNIFIDAHMDRLQK